MAQKKLQLSEIKVKSFVTLVDRSEQKTSKGGYGYNFVHKDKNFTEVIGIDQTVGWTEYKTLYGIKSNSGDLFISSTNSGNNSRAL